MRAVQAKPLTLAFDTVSIIPDRATAAALRDNVPATAAFRYLDTLTDSELVRMTDVGLLVGPVTYADEFDGAAAVVKLRQLGVPEGVDVWLDLEAASALDPATIIAKVDAWSWAIQMAGYGPALYYGAGCKLTSAELSALVSHRYWSGCSRLVDRNGNVCQPDRGPCVIQLRPDDVTIAGVKVDVSAFQQDYRGDLPMLVGG